MDEVGLWPADQNNSMAKRRKLCRGQSGGKWKHPLAVHRLYCIRQRKSRGWCAFASGRETFIIQYVQPLKRNKTMPVLVMGMVAITTEIM